METTIGRTGHSRRKEKKVARGLYAAIAAVVLLAIAAFALMSRRVDTVPQPQAYEFSAPAAGPRDGNTTDTNAAGQTENRIYPATPAEKAGTGTRSEGIPDSP
ncbi:MAG: hypothetical protein V4736_03020 [Bdellovibrionota bacterium]